MQRNKAPTLKTMSPKEEKSEPIFSINLNNNTTVTNVEIEETKTNETAKSEKKKSAIFSLTLRQKLILALLCMADFMAYAAIALISPFFPKEAELKGMSKSLFGYAFSFPSLVLFIASPIVGKLIPKLGEKVIYVGGFFSLGITHIIFGTLVYVDNYTWYVVLCFLIRGLQALGSSGYLTVSFVYATKLFPDCPGFVRGTLETFVGLGLSVGPAIGGLLYSVGGFGLPFYVMGAATLCVLPLFVIILPKSLANASEEKAGSVLNLVKIPSVFITVLIVIVVSMTWGFLEPSLEPHIRMFELSSANVGLVFLLLAGLYAVSSPAWGWVADRLDGHWSLMAIGLFFISIGLIFIGPSPFFPFISVSLPLVLVCLCCISVATAMALMPTFNAVIVHALATGLEDNLTTHSLIAGVWSSSYALGEVIGPSLGGVLVENYGYETASTVFSFVNLILVIICLIYFNLDKLKKKSKPAIQIDNELNGVWKSNPL